MFAITVSLELLVLDLYASNDVDFTLVMQLFLSGYVMKNYIANSAIENIWYTISHYALYTSVLSYLGSF